MRYCLLALLVSSPVLAEPVIHSLSPEAREAAIEAASRQPETNTRIRARAPESAAQDRRIHGEMGMSIGNNGHRSVFGSTMVPLGENGSAAFSFSTGRDNFGGYGMGFGMDPRMGYGGMGYGGIGYGSMGFGGMGQPGLCFRPPYCR